MLLCTLSVSESKPDPPRGEIFVYVTGSKLGMMLLETHRHNEAAAAAAAAATATSAHKGQERGRGRSAIGHDGLLGIFMHDLFEYLFFC